jgi:hypothetical protein
VIPNDPLMIYKLLKFSGGFNSPVHSQSRCNLAGGAGCGRDLRQSEVENLGMARLSNKDVRRLDVAVDDSFGMSGVWCIGNLDSEQENRHARQCDASGLHHPRTPWR